MKKYLLLFGLIAMAACSSSRDDKSCNCYVQTYYHVVSEKNGKIIRDTWNKEGDKRDYSKNCDDNNKKIPLKKGSITDETAWGGSVTTITYEDRVECK
ncbi:hypothetical protein CMT52_06025 [Elizabethkingia anophelis]|nr:hypothetical protein [Elizabethkingia anophelis]